MQEIEINATVRAVPETHPDTKRPLQNAGAARNAKVIYIHPEARYYVIEFSHGKDSFRESRHFTPEQREAHLQRLRGKRKRTRATATPPGYYALPEETNNEEKPSAAEDFSTMF